MIAQDVLPSRLPLTFLLTAAGMLLFESAKQGMFPNISIWESHAVTIVFASVIATVVAHFVGQLATRLHRAVLDELTERKKAQELLAHREEDLRITLDSIGDAVMATDAEGKITRMNPVAERLTGWALADAKGQPVEKVFCIRSEETGQTVESPVEKVLREGLVVGLANHTELLARDGSRRPIADSGAPIRDTQNRIVGVVLVFRDQTSERQANQAVQESEASLKAIVNTTPNVAIQGYDSNGVVVFWNKASESMFGFQASESLGKTLDQLIHTPEEAAAFKSLLQDLQASGKHVGPTEYTFRRRNGTQGTCLSTVFGIPNLDGRKAFICMDVDITSRKTSEEARLRLTTVLESTSDLVGTSDLQGRITYLNNAGRTMAGLRTDADLTQMHIKDFHPDWSSKLILEEGLPAAMRDGVWRGETALRTGNGAEMAISQVIIAHKDESGSVQFYSTIARDISERKRAEEALRDRETRLRQSEAALQAMVNALPEPAFLLDRKQTFVTANEALLRGFHRTLSEVTGRKATEFLPRDLAQARYERLETVMASGKPTVFEDSNNNKHFRNYLCPAVASTGQVTGVAVFALDITDRKRAEEALREAEQRYSAFVTTSSECIGRYELDRPISISASVDEQIEHFLDGAYLAECNDAMARLHGYNRAVEFQGQRLTDFLPRSEPHTREFARAIMASGYRISNFETQERDRFGHRLLLSNNVVGIVENQKVVRFWGTQVDITERKLIEGSLRQIATGTAATSGAEFFRSMVKHLAQSLGVKYALVGGFRSEEANSIQTLAVWAGERFADNFSYDLSGTPCQNVVAKSFCCYPQDVCRQFPDDKLLADMGVVSYMGIPLFGAQGKVTGILVVLDDKPLANIKSAKTMLEIFAVRAGSEIERVEGEKKLLVYQQQLQGLASQVLMVEEQERRKFSQLLHDHIGQNLTFARMKLGVLRSRSNRPEVSESLAEVLPVLEQISQETRSLTYELSPPILYEIGLNAALEWLGEHFHSRYKLECVVENSDARDRLGMEARVTLFQAARELLFNVVKHAQASRVNVCCEQDGELLRLSIRDNGRGFDSKHIGASMGKGGGFGLFNVRERMRFMKGEMHIESAPGQGTCVTLELPLVSECVAT